MAQQFGVADLLVRCLEREGVTVVFGIPGEENIGFVDALAQSSIRYVLVRHEQAASFMAEIYGRVTGRAGVCSATLGPGAINLLLGTADATTNSTPVVALSAQVGLSRIYKESHQSVDLVAMFSPVTKWADLVLTPGGGAGDGPQGVQAGPDRTPRCGLPGRARGHRGHVRAGRPSPAQPQHSPAGRALAVADRAGCGSAQRGPPARRPGRARGGPGRRGGRCAALLRAAGPAGCYHLSR